MNNVIKDFLLGDNNNYMQITTDKVEKELEEIVTKLENGKQLESDEQRFLNQYMEKYYPKRVNLYPYPKYDDYLKPIHKRLAKYYISNIDDNNYESIIYLQYYFLTDMCKEFDIKPRINVGNEEFFEKSPDAMAYHAKEYISKTMGYVPNITYNPSAIKEAVNSRRVLDLINYGFHELEHEVQDNQIESEKLKNPESLLWAKEKLSRHVIGEVFYESNYTDLFYERDARDYAYKRILTVINEYGNPNTKYTITSFLTEDAHYDTSLKFTDIESKEEKKAIDLLDGITSTYLKAYPHLLKQYPVLKNIYNENGSKKLLTQIQMELNLNQEEEINKNPSNQEKIKNKYSKLLDGIIETDHDLLIQCLCQDIYKLSSNNENIHDKQIEINKVVSDVDISYDDIMNRLNNRIHELEKSKNSNDSNISNELEATKLLKDGMLKYIQRFKEKHNNDILVIEYKHELESKFGLSIDKYNYFATDNGVLIANNKNLDELDNDFFSNKEKIKEANIEQDKLAPYLLKLKKIYDTYEQELTTSPFYKAKETLKKQQEIHLNQMLEENANNRIISDKQSINHK